MNSAEFRLRTMSSTPWEFVAALYYPESNCHECRLVQGMTPVIGSVAALFAAYGFIGALGMVAFWLLFFAAAWYRVHSADQP